MRMHTKVQWICVLFCSMLIARMTQILISSMEKYRIHGLINSKSWISEICEICVVTIKLDPRM